MAETEKATSFFDFLAMSRTFFKVIGIDPYKSSRKSLLFWLGSANLFVGTNLGIVMLYKSLCNATNFLQSISLAPCLAIIIVAQFKVLILFMSYDEVSRVLRGLDELFPTSAELQRKYGVKRYIKVSTVIGCTVSYLNITTNWLFNLYPLALSLLEICNGSGFTYRLSYEIWYPFDYTKSAIVYAAVLVHQCFAGHQSSCSITACNLFVFNVVAILSMYFSAIADEVTAIPISGRPEDKRILARVVRRHQAVLEIAEVVARVFSNMIFCNFLLSIVIICMVGFTATAGVNFGMIVKYLVFLAYELAEVFALCYLGEFLISKSTKVAQAAYDSNWYNGDRAYRTMILTVITRSQKPAVLTANFFNVISLESFTRVLSSSYEFFAILKTMYQK